MHKTARKKNKNNWTALFLNNVQGSPKSAKSVAFYTGFDPKFSYYFELTSKI